MAEAALPTKGGNTLVLEAENLGFRKGWGWSDKRVRGWNGNGLINRLHGSCWSVAGVTMTELPQVGSTVCLDMLSEVLMIPT